MYRDLKSKKKEPSGGWVQYAPDAWRWDKHLDVCGKDGKQTEKQLYLHWPKGYSFKKENKVSNTDPFSSEQIVEDLNKMEEKKAKKAKTKASSSAPKKRASTAKVIEFVTMPDKCPRQMRVILTKLSEFGKGGVSIEMLCDKLEGVLNTKQPVEKVYRHYHREMVDKEYIRVLS
jgi:hypothetical protein